MSVVKAGAVKVLVLVVMMLAAIGGWEVSKAVVQKAHGGDPSGGCDPATDPACPNPSPFTHFTCYRIHDKHPHTGFVAEVRIDNQFETSFSRVKDEGRLLCAPTAKLLISISHVTHDHHRGDVPDKDKKKEYEKDKGKGTK